MTLSLFEELSEPNCHTKCSAAHGPSNGGNTRIVAKYPLNIKAPHNPTGPCRLNAGVASVLRRLSASPVVTVFDFESVARIRIPPALLG